MQKTFNQISQSAVYKEDDISVSITVCGGSYGGGSEVLIVNVDNGTDNHIRISDKRERRSMDDS